jgi:CDGSH-type Zn-finger protein/truncated hemoglobin YjbI
MSDIRRELTALLGRAENLAAGDDAVAARLTRSVIRPLEEALGDETTETPPSPDYDTPDTLWRLTVDATRLRLSPDAPAELLEAVAALQDLALTLGAGDAGDLRDIQGELPPGIRCQRNGPYLVTNTERLIDRLGRPIPVRPQMALCRCGGSATKPFCDGTHAENGFTDAKDPERVPDRRDTYPGQQVTIHDNRGVCQHSGYCTDRLSTVFRLKSEPFVAPSGGRMDEIIRAVRDCPSGALSYGIDGHEARAETDHGGTREPAVEVTKDGPYRVTGGLPLTDADGDDEPRGEGASREHYALCRCGHSQNKPFCSGMHWYVDFTDPVPDPEHAPTIFEWAGGLPALLRMTRLFYEKYVPQDPLLAPLFATMSPDHPQRVAAWLAEVFCGPQGYSGEYGGYARMLSQHVGKGLTEEKRARWVTLILRSAEEAGLPSDPEFRSAFSSYIEWGSRLALENSQPGARPPAHMPMPRWDWNTAAGPPGSRISALASAPQPEERPVVLPGEGEDVGFERHIRALFRDGDRRSMSFAFDLWSHEDVTRHADAILGRLRDGSMPCDGAWPAEWVEAFERWVNTGMHP